MKHGHNDGQATRSVLGLVSFVVDYSRIDRGRDGVLIVFLRTAPFSSALGFAST